MIAVEFSEVVRRRRMVRNYTEEPVDDSSLERIVEAGRRAPSAGFSQGQAFVVVTDPDQRHALAKAAGEDEYLEAGFDRWVSRAPALIVLYVSEEIYHRRYQEADKTGPDGEEIEWPVPYWWVDAGASMQSMLLAAVAEGLAAGFLGSHAVADIQSLLRVPDHYRFVGIITVGHPAPDRRSGSLRRGWKERSKVVHRDRWSD